jgi:hypothetical protein
VIAREMQRKLVGSGAITDGETDAKNASVDGPLGGITRVILRPRVGFQLFNRRWSLLTNHFI